MYYNNKLGELEQGNVLKSYYWEGRTFWFEKVLPRFLSDTSELLVLCENRDSSYVKREIYSKQDLFTKFACNKHCHHTSSELHQ